MAPPNNEGHISSSVLNETAVLPSSSQATNKTMKDVISSPKKKRRDATTATATTTTTREQGNSDKNLLSPSIESKKKSLTISESEKPSQNITSDVEFLSPKKSKQSLNNKEAKGMKKRQNSLNMNNNVMLKIPRPLKAKRASSVSEGMASVSQFSLRTDLSSPIAPTSWNGRKERGSCLNSVAQNNQELVYFMSNVALPVSPKKKNKNLNDARNKIGLNAGNNDVPPTLPKRKSKKSIKQKSSSNVSVELNKSSSSVRIGMDGSISPTSSVDGGENDRNVKGTSTDNNEQISQSVSNENGPISPMKKKKSLKKKGKGLKAKQKSLNINNKELSKTPKSLKGMKSSSFSEGLNKAHLKIDLLGPIPPTASNDQRAGDSGANDVEMPLETAGKLGEKRTTKIIKRGDEESGEALECEVPNTSIRKRTNADSPRRGWCRCAVILLVLVALAAAAAAVVYFYVFKDDDTINDDDGIARMEDSNEEFVVSELPIDVCNEGVPGQGKSKICTPQETSVMGAPFCNLVAQAMMNATASDMAIINAGACLDDLHAPQVKVSDISAAIKEQKLVVLEMSGGDLLKLLEDVMEATFGGANSTYEPYPYAAGLRYQVAANQDVNNRVTLATVDVDHSGVWRPVSHRKFYKIVTTTQLAEGRLGYWKFASVIDDWKASLSFTTRDSFLNYALNTASWWELSYEKYSTQSFVAPDVEIGVASVPQTVCLEWAPATGKSKLCSSQDTSLRGGGVCNLVAWALLDQNLEAQVAILKAEDCGSDIASGPLSKEDANDVLPNNPSLVTLQLSGTQIKVILEDAVDATLRAENPRDGAYPYAGGLRYQVDTTATQGNRVSFLETYTNNRWIPLEEDSLYTTLTTSDLAGGTDEDYQGFVFADPSTLVQLDIFAVDAFLQYATDWKVLYDPPQEKYSTQSYIT